MSGLITGLNGHSKASTLVDSTGAEYAIGDIDDTEVLTVDGSSIVSGAGSSGGGSWYSTRPSYMGAASAYDDEFTSDTSANWTFNTAPSGTIDQYVTVASNPRVSWAGIRSSHLSVQAINGTTCRFWRAVTLSTNHWIWARATVQSETSRTVSTTDRTQWIVALSENGDFSTGHYVYVRAGQAHNGVTANNASVAKNDSGGVAEVGNVLANDTSNSATQVFIQKVSNAYYFYAGNDQGEWWYLGTHTHSGNTLDNISFAISDQNTAPGSGVVHLDFIRAGTGTIQLP